jgi:hypothetical protein
VNTAEDAIDLVRMDDGPAARLRTAHITAMDRSAMVNH